MKEKEKIQSSGEEITAGILLAISEIETLKKDAKNPFDYEIVLEVLKNELDKRPYYDEKIVNNYIDTKFKYHGRKGLVTSAHQHTYIIKSSLISSFENVLKALDDKKSELIKNEREGEGRSK